MSFLQRFRFLGNIATTRKCLRTFSSGTDQDNTPTDNNKISGYAKAFDKFEQIKTTEPQKQESFASLLRNSKFIDVSYLQIKRNLFMCLSFRWVILKEKWLSEKYFMLLRMIST